MQFVYSFFNDCLYNFVSVLSDPIVLLPVGSSVLICLAFGVFYALTRPRRNK